MSTRCTSLSPFLYIIVDMLTSPLVNANTRLIHAILISRERLRVVNGVFGVYLLWLCDSHKYKNRSVILASLHSPKVSPLLHSGILFFIVLFPITCDVWG